MRNSTKDFFATITLLLFFCYTTNANLQTFPNDSIKTEKDSTINVGNGEEKLNLFAGSAISIQQKNFNVGFFNSPFELIVGRAPNLSILPYDGSPGSLHQVKYRGQASFNTLSPQIYIDDQPLFNTRISSNPYDIEKVSIVSPQTGSLIDQNPYGGIIFTHKKGTKDFQVNYLGSFAFTQKPKKVDVYSANEFRALIIKQYADRPEIIERLGSASTDWQDEIYQKAFSHQHHVSVSGTVKNILPFYASFGQNTQEGTVKNSDYNQTTFNLNLTPSFFDDHLKLKFLLNKNIHDRNIIDDELIKLSLHADPTQKAIIDQSDDPYLFFNPTTLMEMRKITHNEELTFLSSQIEYILHFLPELRLGFCYSQNRSKFVENTVNKNSNNILKENEKTDKLWRSYLVFKSLKTENIFQYLFRAEYNELNHNYSFHDQIIRDSETSFSKGIGDRTNSSLLVTLALSYKNRYYVNINAVRSADSRLVEGNMWSTSSNLSVGWNLKNEEFLLNNNLFSTFNFQYNYNLISANISEIKPIDNHSIFETYPMLNFDLDKEKAKQFSLGMNVGILKNKLTGSVFFFNRSNKDILTTINTSWGSGFSKYMIINANSIKSKGFEIRLNSEFTNNKSLHWDISGTFAMQEDIFKKHDDPRSLITNYVLINSDNQPLHSFYVRTPDYNSKEKPIEWQQPYEVEREIESQAYPKIQMSLASNLNYNNWHFDFSGRIDFGHSVYNYIDAQACYDKFYNYFENQTKALEKNNFTKYQVSSSHYLENASYFKMDYIRLGYSFEENLFKHINLSLSGIIQNAFIITNYSGLNPITTDGMDNYQYPQSRSFVFQLRMLFK